ncbi:PREDICTED: uncharacterized protein LOC109338415 [Lupinus angustifolius]|uniref:uncharacterized protein LOC109338415 n=1 Tax=Lupinus angustifolius TaxID=3871 RepID=UPI00092E3C54|nr:PREDICTED: uncharacterized protein LOC109338415 [Lupinus angustifolius]
MIHFDVVHLSFWNSLNLKVFASNDRPELSPSLLGVCRLDMDPSVIRVSNQHFSVSVMKDNMLSFIGVVYAHTNYAVRRSLWLNLQEDMVNHQGPWCLIGDFNAVLGAYECRGPSLPNRISCTEFNSFLDDNLLINIPTIGATFTWTNRRLGAANTERRLDRAICNEEWINNWSQVSCCSLPRLASDHHPLLLNLASDIPPRPSSFRFHKMWLQNEDCKRVVSHIWHTRITGCPMYILTQKIIILKNELKHWNKTVFGNIHHKVILAKNNVEQIQNCIRDSDPSNHLYHQEDLAQSELLKALQIEEIFWKEKARINWHNFGDRNTAYFHKIAKIKLVTKAMSLIKSGDVLLTEQDAIASHALDYYTNLFATPNFVTS